jgi:hypothetical protein
MTRKKKILYVFIGIITLFFLFLVWYKVTYSMDEAASYEINSPTNQTKLLIATQGSEFKNAITENIVNYYKKDSLYIKVIDVSLLDKINANKFNAIFLFHTWENLKPPIEVEKFIESNKALKSKIIIYTTSGNGSYKMENVDALTGESNIEDVKKVSNQITRKLDDLL